MTDDIIIYPPVDTESHEGTKEDLESIMALFPATDPDRERFKREIYEYIMSKTEHLRQKEGGKP